MCVSYLIRIFRFQLGLNGILVDTWLQRIRIRILSFPSDPKSSILMVNVWSLKHPSCFPSHQFFVWTYVLRPTFSGAACSLCWTVDTPRSTLRVPPDTVYKEHCVQYLPPSVPPRKPEKGKMSLLTPCTRNIVCNISLLVSLPTNQRRAKCPSWHHAREALCPSQKYQRGKVPLTHPNTP